MGLQMRMWLLVALMSAILYGIIVALGSYAGVNDPYAYIVMAVLVVGLQYLLGPSLVGMMMRVRYVSEEEEPELHQMVAELANRAGLPKPRVGISEVSIPNAFAFGRSIRDGRVCVTRGILQLLSRDELRAVLGHEMTHLKNRDMIVITFLSVIPLVCYWAAWNLMFRRSRDDRGGNYTVLVGIGAFAMYFISNLLVLYGSRIREYYADEGSVKLGNAPSQLATALYKLVYGSVRLKNDPRAQYDLHRIQGVKAFFVNDVAHAAREINQLREIDPDNSGTISANEMYNLRSRPIRLRSADRMIELFTTHPNMLKRIKRLSTLA
jgi:heat shock protein HtpX